MYEKNNQIHIVMAQRKGQTGNPNGRPKGTPNKTTMEMKELITGFLSNNLETIQRDFDQLEPAKRFEVLDRLMKYVLPSRSEIKQEIETDDTAHIHLFLKEKEASLL
jgi:hypothetical protein